MIHSFYFLIPSTCSTVVLLFFFTILSLVPYYSNSHFEFFFMVWPKKPTKELNVKVLLDIWLSYKASSSSPHVRQYFCCSFHNFVVRLVCQQWVVSMCTELVNRFLRLYTVSFDNGYICKIGVKDAYLF